MSDRALQSLPGLEPAVVHWRIDEDLLVVEFRGRRHDAAHMAGCWHAVRRLAAEAGRDRILAIDLMDDDPLNGEQRKAFIEGLGVDMFIGRRWAYVARSIDRVGAYEATQIDVQELGVDVRVFSSRAEAEVWLRHAA